MSVLRTHRMTPQEYLEIERKADFKSEYINGEVFAMSGGSQNHNRISLNIGAELHDQLKGRPCEAFLHEQKIGVANGAFFFYPDISVVCGEPQVSDKYQDVILNPTVVIEVLSPSTESYDRKKKFDYYRAIESLVEYILVAQDEYRIEQFVRQKDGSWSMRTLKNLTDVIDMATIDCQVQLSDIYDRVQF